MYVVPGFPHVREIINLLYLHVTFIIVEIILCIYPIINWQLGEIIDYHVFRNFIYQKVKHIFLAAERWLAVLCTSFHSVCNAIITV